MSGFTPFVHLRPASSEPRVRFGRKRLNVKQAYDLKRIEHYQHLQDQRLLG